jgi:hypothetical protein
VTVEPDVRLGSRASVRAAAGEQPMSAFAEDRTYRPRTIRSLMVASDGHISVRRAA